MALTELDRQRLHEALDLARGSFGLTEPNPRVGCIIGLDNGEVLGRGATQAAGQAHAEVMALREAAAAGAALNGATAWVTLEPCAHHGRTPPCCDALIAAGIARCVVALGDPFPAVAGGGLRRLREAGVAVELVDDATIIEQATDINIGFLTRIKRGTPWVRLKVAASLDGRTALANGRSQWITGAAARADGHAWRRRASAVLTGVGTVLADDPRLDVRAVATVYQPLRIVLDTQLRTPPTAALLRPPGRAIIVAAAGQSARADALRAVGAEVWDEAAARPDLTALLRRLGQQGINELHIEAGPTLSGAWLETGLVDELLVYLAPSLLGPGRPFATLAERSTLPTAPDYRWQSVQTVGQDLRLLMRRDAIDSPLPVAGGLPASPGETVRR
ncbi:fused diaminohydroxyphosphoribosylaminopyrimidine deaminase;5-amino-6-(5-phosphoribosylamino) uracil reductase [Rubrivivax sp. A210]|uniref:bifunctional diaminohydroxyphosphoribosylaminopyrimidine deaminase/5-amino-6-(5-phosphoribosylamino)uracil reductase RibD n=1 Tax=Rubrivivax sp. A210 TaxID=2772301 RepID=UPI001917E414|nr:bifunctional diaminohydroxyphosphoribosylaminopyrimidine deaminase/5-amino-6-(5-phosphoribosylamino)uracil reductase RibD [Rubrivivax sp. A210]CAD5372086.1 fused diaminohydroxyphosphoribosylaminopyrimidine deaminase;5-amino-6-(5-phosphoribosylamino) uracil reductase [Rubrivivax sp. A210]